MNRGLSIVGVVLLVAGCARFHPQPISPARTANEFESRSLTNPDLQAFLAANGISTNPAPQWNLKSLTLVALFYQPDLAAARTDWALAQAGRVTAGQRPNPSINFTPEYDTTTPPPWIWGITWDIPIETAGKRGYRLAQAEHLSDAARWNFVTAAWAVRSNLRTALLNLYSARQTASLLEQQAIAQSNVVRLLEGQLQAGNVSEYEVTQARIALSTSRLSLDDARRQQAGSEVKLADALGVSTHALQDVSLSFSGLDEFPTNLTAPEVRRHAIVSRSDIRAALADYAASQSALQLEIARQYPDLNIGPGYQRDQADNKWSLGVTVTLPILNQNQGPIAEAEAKRRQAAAHFLAVQSKAIGEIDLALAGYKAALDQSATAASLMKDLRSRLNSVRAMQQAGELDPLALANARVEYNIGALSRLDALVKAQTALGALEDATQSPLVLSDAVIQKVSQ